MRKNTKFYSYEFPKLRLMVRLHHRGLAWLLGIALCGVWLPSYAKVLGEYELQQVNRDHIDALVAAVNGEVITLGDILNDSSREEATLYAIHSDAELKAAITETRFAVLESLIDRKLLIAQFKQEELTVPGQYVESLLDDLAESFGCNSRSELVRKANLAGISMESLREKATERIMIDMLIGRQLYAAINPTPKEIYEYYTNHPEQFTTPERLVLELLLLKDESAVSAAELRSILDEHPERFAELVRSFSVGPNRERGGAIGEVDRTKLRKEFAEVLEHTSPTAGAILGPVTTTEGFYFLHLAEMIPAKTLNFREAAPVVKQILERDLRDAAVRAYTEKLRKKAMIRYYVDPPTSQTETPTLEALPASGDASQPEPPTEIHHEKGIE